MTLRHPKMHHHIKFGSPTSKNIGDMHRTRSGPERRTDGRTVGLLYASQSSKSVPRVIIRHHKACRVMTYGDPKEQIFLSILTQITDSFFCTPGRFTQVLLYYPRLKSQVFIHICHARKRVQQHPSLPFQPILYCCLDFL